MPDYTFQLSRAERQQSSWVKIQRHFQHLLDKSRRLNDSRMNADDTAYTRGKIALVKELIGLNEVERTAEDEE